MEISEILFNELAFFKLMQDLDNNSSIALGAKQKSRKKAEQQPSKAKLGLQVLFSLLCVVIVILYRNVNPNQTNCTVGIHTCLFRKLR